MLEGNPSYHAPWLIEYGEPVVLHSGGRSHWLIDAAAIFRDEALRGIVLDYWMRVLGDWSMRCRPPYAITGIPSGGIAWAIAFRERCEREGLLAMQTQHLPTVANGIVRIVVDDVVTTGKSIEAPSADIRLAVIDRRIDPTLEPLVFAWQTIYLPIEDEPRA